MSGILSVKWKLNGIRVSTWAVNRLWPVALNNGFHRYSRGLRQQAGIDTLLSLFVFIHSTCFLKITNVKLRYRNHVHFPMQPR